MTDGRTDRPTDGQICRGHYSDLHCEQCGRAVKIKENVVVSEMYTVTVLSLMKLYVIILVVRSYNWLIMSVVFNVLFCLCLSADCLECYQCQQILPQTYSQCNRTAITSQCEAQVSLSSALETFSFSVTSFTSGRRLQSLSVLVKWLHA